MTTTAYTPPASLMEVLQKIDFEEALDAADQRYVPTEEARGSEQTYKRLARKLGWNAERNAFFPPASRHVLFFGHVGSGSHQRPCRGHVYVHVRRLRILASAPLVTRRKMLFYVGRQLEIAALHAQGGQDVLCYVLGKR